MPKESESQFRKLSCMAMAGATVKIPMSGRLLMCENYTYENSGEAGMNLSDTVFEFLDESYEGSSKSTNGRGYDENDHEEIEEEEEEESSRNVEDDRGFWETQHQLLHVSCKSLLIHTTELLIPQFDLCMPNFN